MPPAHLFQNKLQMLPVLTLIQNKCYALSKIAEIQRAIYNSYYTISKQDKACFINSIRSAIGIRTRKAKSGELAVGISKIGGHPDLPTGFQWPRFHEKPLAFIAQYNCSELKKYDQENLFPSKGMLYLFFCLPDSWCDELLTETGSFKIIYHPSHRKLVKTDFPDDYIPHQILAPATVDFFEYYTPPDEESLQLQTLYRNPFFEDFYGEIVDSINEITGQSDDILHQMGGEDRSIDKSVMLHFAEKEWLEIKKAGVSLHQSRLETINRLRKQYQLLLQLDCYDANTDLRRFNGHSVIYFGIKTADLRKKQFEDVKMVWQLP